MNDYFVEVEGTTLGANYFGSENAVVIECGSSCIRLQHRSIYVNYVVIAIDTQTEYVGGQTPLTPRSLGV
jgi:hypothetical protein